MQEGVTPFMPEREEAGHTAIAVPERMDAEEIEDKRGHGKEGIHDILRAR